MPIDVTTEPGRTLAYLARQLEDPERKKRLDNLQLWYSGTPQLSSDIPDAARKAVREFHELASTGLAELIVEAVRERQRIRGIRTAADDDSTGDSAAFKLWGQMYGAMISADVHRLKARFGTAYAMVSQPPADNPGVPILTAEDPRYCVADLDPLRPWIPRSFLKMLHDPMQGVSRAYLVTPGRVDVAELATRSKTGVRFNASSWNWNTQESRDLKPGLMPVASFEALDGVGEFENHLRLLRRIDFMVLQQLSIAVLQAFKQRAVKGVPREDGKGNVIDYDKLFEAGPNALWLLPATAEMWESGQVDLNGILTAVRDYIRQLAAATRTPLSMMEASGENQSAEGASAAREGLVFKVEDRNLRDGASWGRVIEMAGRWIDQPLQEASVIWAPPQRSSLIERATAMAAARAAGLPFRTLCIEFGEFDPAEVDRMEQELAVERLDAQIAAAAAQPAPATALQQPQTSAGAPNAAPAPNATPQPVPPAQGGAQPTSAKGATA